MLGVAGMLVVAGLIEGFVSPQRFSPEVRFAVGALTGILLCAYFGFAGRAAAWAEPKRDRFTERESATADRAS
jgi:hypothetical protein